MSSGLAEVLYGTGPIERWGNLHSKEVIWGQREED